MPKPRYSGASTALNTGTVGYAGSMVHSRNKLLHKSKGMLRKDKDEGGKTSYYR